MFAIFYSELFVLFLHLFLTKKVHLKKVKLISIIIFLFQINFTNIYRMSQVPSPSTTFSASRPPSVPLSLNAPRFRLVTSSNFSAADSRQRITQPPPDYLTGSVPLSAQYIVSTSDAIMQRPRMSPVIRTQLPDVNSPVASNVSSSIMMSQPASTLQSTPQSNFTVTPRASGADNDQAVAKCARFFKTLLHLSEKQQYNNQQSPDTVAAVRQLIRVYFSCFGTSTLKKSKDSFFLVVFSVTIPILRESYLAHYHRKSLRFNYRRH